MVWLMNFVEFQNFGWNAITISAIATLIFTVFEGWGLIKQSLSIWQNKSVESLSAIWFIYFLFMLLSFFIYGINNREIAISFNGLMFICVIPIVSGLWKFGRLSNIERILFFVCFSSIVLMILFPVKSFFIYFLGSVIFLSFQPLKIWKEKSRGVVEVKLIWIYFYSTLFFIIYAFSVRDFVLIFLYSVTLMVLIVTLLLWYKFRKE